MRKVSGIRKLKEVSGTYASCLSPCYRMLTCVSGVANVNFTGAISKATPLILAAKYSRSNIVSRLIKAKANTSARDRFDRSSLFYASQSGDIASVKALLKAKAPANDGSLQEAAKNLHSEVVAALIKGKHSPDFPSSKEQHQGRSALQEMCLMCDGTRDPTELEATIRCLVKGKANVLEKSREKNSLFLALDNAHPVPVTKALLDISMWKHINDKDNVYAEVDPETATKYFFSPTMYVTNGFSQGPEPDNSALVQLLNDKRCNDRFYAEAGAEQPEGVIGMPPDVAEAEKKRKAHEDKLHKKEMEHQLKLLHEKQAAELKAEIERSKHEEKLFREDELAHQKHEQKEIAHQQCQPHFRPLCVHLLHLHVMQFLFMRHSPTHQSQCQLVLLLFDRQFMPRLFSFHIRHSFRCEQLPLARSSNKAILSLLQHQLLITCPTLEAQFQFLLLFQCCRLDLRHAQLLSLFELRASLQRPHLGFIGSLL